MSEKLTTEQTELTPEDMEVDALELLRQFYSTDPYVEYTYGATAHRDAPALARRALAAEKRVKELGAECKRLRGIVNGMADRVAAQSELLSKNAERTEGNTP